MDRVTVAVWHLDHRSHDARPSVDARVWRGVDVSHVNWTALFALNGALHGVARHLHLVVDVRPRHAIRIELDHVLVHALEPIGMEATAILLLPHNILCVSQPNLSHAR